MFARRTTALRIVLQQGRFGCEFVENAPQMRGALRPDDHVARPPGRHAPRVFKPGCTGGLSAVGIVFMLPDALRMGDRRQERLVLPRCDVGQILTSPGAHEKEKI